MSLSFSELMRMVLRTLQSPREGAAEVLALGVPREAHVLLMAVVVILSALLTQFFAVLALIVSPAAAMAQTGLTVTVAIHFGSLITLIALVQGIGRAMGGTGRIEETTVLMCWLQFVMMVVSVAQSLLILVMPPIAGLVLFVGVGILFWLLTHFIAALHGFRSLAGVFGMIIATAFMVAFALTILLQVAGVEIPMPMEAV